MESVTKILLFLGKLVLNIVGIAIGLYLYKSFVRPLSIGPVMPDYFQEIIAVVLLMIGLPLLSMKQVKPLNHFSIGIMGVLIPLVLFGVFALNQHSSAPSYTRLYPIERKTLEDDSYLLSAYVYEKSNWVQLRVPKDECLKLDSVQIKIIDGLLGMKIVTNEVEFSKKPGCGS